MNIKQLYSDTFQRFNAQRRAHQVVRAIAEGLFGLRAVEEFVFSRVSKNAMTAKDASLIVQTGAGRCNGMDVPTHPRTASMCRSGSA